MGYKFYKFDKLIVTGSGDKTIKVWSLLDFSCKKTLEGHTNSVQRVKFSIENILNYYHVVLMD